MYTQSSFETYDKKVGMSGSIGNMVNSMNGTDLNLQFTDPQNDFDDLKCNGSFKFHGDNVFVKSYLYWDGKGKFFILTLMGPKTELTSMDRILDSVRIVP